MTAASTAETSFPEEMFGGKWPGGKFHLVSLIEMSREKSRTERKRPEVH